jgi:hypothetical protein
MNLQKFVPAFIKQFDHYLLTHYPIIWQSRIHNVIYAVLTTDILLALLASLIPVEIGQSPEIGTWIWIFFILAVTYLVIWMVHAGRFNLFKHYGKRPIGDEYINFFLNLICVTLIVSTMFVFPVVLESKSKNVESYKEIAQDINKLNLGAPFFPLNAYNYNNTGEQISDTGFKIKLYNYTTFGEFGYSDLLSYQNRDNGNIGRSFRKPESVESEISNYDYNNEMKGDSNELGLYNKSYTQSLFQKRKSRAEQLKMIEDYIATEEKYGSKFDYEAAYYLNQFDAANDYTYKGSLNYNNYSYTARYRIASLIRIKNEPLFVLRDGFLHALWYFLFYITLLFMIYRNVRRRDFTLSLVSGIVIMIVTSIFLAVSGAFRTESIYGTYLFIYIALFFGAVSIFFSTKHHWASVACLNLVVIATPFMPVFTYLLTDHNGRDESTTYELIGFMAFVVLLQIFFKKLYAIQWSLPD